MDAASEAEFDELSLETGKKLWPGKITICHPDGSRPEIDCSVTVGAAQVQLNDSQAGGLVTVRALSAEIPKCDHPTEPENGLVIKYTLSGQVETFKIDQVHGQSPSDASWFIRAIDWKN